MAEEGMGGGESKRRKNHRDDQGTEELEKKWGAGGQREDQLLRPGED